MGLRSVGSLPTLVMPDRGLSLWRSIIGVMHGTVTISLLMQFREAFPLLWRNAWFQPRKR